MRNRRRTKERSFGCVPSKIMTARFLRSWWEEGRGGEEVVTNPGSYHVLSTRAAPSEGTTPRERERERGAPWANLPKLGAEFSPGRHLAALSAPVHVERSQRPVIVAWDRVAGIAQPPRPPTLPTPRPSNNETRRDETRGEEDVHERASHEQIDERIDSDVSN